jgi:c-di-GMP-binding flagellar brake protein YcgR
VGDDERREFFRVMVRLAISCLTVDGDGGAHLLAVRSVDLSAGGVKIVTEHSLEPGQEVRPSFQVGDPPERMRQDASVARIERLGDGFHLCALEFPRLDLSRERRLVQAVFAQEHQNAERHAQVRMSV